MDLNVPDQCSGMITQCLELIIQYIENDGLFIFEEIGSKIEVSFDISKTSQI